ncbi:MAG: hypothetical protein FJX25_11965 [Alphaproteobacteria bacterium]|nr:hypothetical protein [Alphaproteobacteria bacterium]
MISAFLRLEGSPQLAGVVEAEGNHLRFRTRTDMTEEELGRLEVGEIEIDGASERVLLVSTQSSREGGYTAELTLHRPGPSPGAGPSGTKAGTATPGKRPTAG